MSNKFTTLVTNEGINLLQASSQQDKKIEFVKAIGSSTAYSTSQLSTVTYADITARAAKNQEGTVNNIVPDKTTTKMELLFDGHDVKSDYTLNSIFIIARLKDSSDYKVFAILKTNQPQYINAYTGDGATNLQINVGVKFDNQDNVSLEINSAALATMGDLQNLSKSTAEKLASENTRATESEQALDKLIEAETKRASNAESTLRSETTAESTRAKGVENELDNKIASETTRATKAENDLAGKITSEQNRAMTKENSLDGKIIQVQTNLNAEQGRATGAEQKLGGRVDSEIARATKAESDIQNQVNAEKSRATAAEGNLNKTITDESNRAKGAESSLSGKVDSETARATKAENDLTGKITSEQNRATAKENQLDSKVQSVKGDLDGIRVGGKNMFHDTSMMTNPSYWNLRGAKVQKALYGDVTHESANFTIGVNTVQAPNPTFIDYVPKANFDTNTFYTLSYWCTSAVPKNTYLNKDDGGSHYHTNAQQTIRTSDTGQRFNGWSRMAVTFKPTVRDAYITFDISGVGWASSFQLEDSTLPSPWGPSANDIESMVSDAKNTLRSETTAESNRAKGVENELRNLANSNRDRLNAKDNQIVIANKGEAIKDLIAVDDKHSKKGVIHSINGDAYGSAVGIGNGGLTVLGGGEGSLAILNNILNKYAIDGIIYNPQDKVLMLASDADVKVIANTQSQNPSNYKISKFKSDGSVVFPGRVYSNGNGTSIEQQIVDERNRATNRENSIDSRVTSESNRAKGVESSLQSQINTEKSRAQGAEANLGNQIDAESNRAQGVENELRNYRKKMTFQDDQKYLGYIGNNGIGDFRVRADNNNTLALEAPDGYPVWANNFIFINKGNNNAQLFGVDGKDWIDFITTRRARYDVPESDPAHFSKHIGRIHVSELQYTALTKVSQLSKKTDVKLLDKQELAAKLLSMDLYKYRYKNQNQNEKDNFGPIIDDVNNVKRYNLAQEFIDTDEKGINISNIVTGLIATVQEQAKQIENLLFRTLELERKVNING